MILEVIILSIKEDKENIASGSAKIDALKPIEIDDLLGRVAVKPSKKLMEISILNLKKIHMIHILV